MKKVLLLVKLLLVCLAGRAQCLSLGELQARLGTTVTADDPVLKRQFTAVTSGAKMIWLARGNANQLVVIQSPTVSLIGYQAVDSRTCAELLLRQIKSASLRAEGTVVDRNHGTTRRYDLYAGDTYGVVVRRMGRHVAIHVCTRATYDEKTAQIRRGEPQL